MQPDDYKYDIFLDLLLGVFCYEKCMVATIDNIEQGVTCLLSNYIEL